MVPFLAAGMRAESGVTDPAMASAFARAVGNRTGQRQRFDLRVGAAALFR